MPPRSPIAFAVAAALLIPWPALAAVYHVAGHDGNDAWPGTTADSAWSTVARANAAARPGDVIYVWRAAPGYEHFPRPDSAGSNPAGGGRITFIGAAAGADPLLDPEVRPVFTAGGTITTPYTVIKGIHAAGSVTLKGGARSCSLAASTIAGDLLLDGCDYAVVNRCLVLGPRLSIAYAGQDSHVVGCEISDSEFPRLGVGVSGGNHRFITGRTRSAKCDSLLFARNRLRTVMEDIADTHPRVHFWTQHSTFRNNHHTILTRMAGREFYAMRLRDSTSHNAFIGDTIVMSGPALAILYWSSEGDSADAWQRTVGSNVVDSCYINLMGSAGSRMLFQQGMYDWTFRHNVMLCHGRPIDAGDVKGKNLLDHNTFVGGPWLGVVNFDKPSAHPGFSDTVTFTNNIVYASYDGPDGDLASNYCAMFAHSQAFDSAGVGRLRSDHNLFSYYGWRFAPGDRVHRWDQGNYSRTGDGGLWNEVYGLDQHSVYGSPRFVDSTLSAIFDPRLLPDSPAIGAGSGGSDIGAVAFAAIVGVTEEPAAEPARVTVWPNPGRGDVAIAFTLPRPGAARLRVFDAAGRLVRRIAREGLAAGAQRWTWDGRDHAGLPTRPGLYFLELRTPGATFTRRVVRLD